MARRVGLFGGTFDPPHIGHLIVAEDATDALGLDAVWFIPAGAHPLKQGRVVASAETRRAMMGAAIAGNDRFECLDVELRRPGPSFSVDTLRILHEADPETEFFFLVGADVVSEFHTWREPETIAKLAHFTILTRGGEEAQALRPAVQVAYRKVAVTRVDISSTEIRRRAREGKPFRYLVPERVYEIIVQQGLYK
ncbi:MAG: nicotinate-nucleotide adenylyltransferase [Gemmatimonadetes bacterium]|nr:nicotinate-nucleotide adenylyltransferase [Gemmatimonadota bacterium]